MDNLGLTTCGTGEYDERLGYVGGCGEEFFSFGSDYCPDCDPDPMSLVREDIRQENIAAAEAARKAGGS